MANTVIQIKRSSATATPSAGSLASAEPAYSFNSDKLFLGNTAGTGIIEIGGKYWVDTTVAAFNQANTAYNAANSAGSSSAIGAARDHANAAFLQANTARDHANSAYAQANAAPDIANSYTVTVGAAANGWANSISATRSTASNAYAETIGTAGNNYTITVGAAANGWANTISSTRADASNAYASSVGTAANAYATAVGTAGNVYAREVGTAGNNYTITVAAAANGWANTVAADAKGYSNSTFVKLTAASQTITGDVSIVGNLTLSGNTTFINVIDLQVSDPLIYLAGNNKTSDIVDIGFLGTYNNGSANLYTGLYREHVDKEYYLFQSYDAEPANNHIGAFSNNMVLAVLNADIRTNNLVLGGANAILTIGAAFDKANAANLLAFNTGAGANAYAQAVGTAGNNYTIEVGAAANGWANTISATRSTASNAYAETIGTAGNNYTITVGAAANGWANTISSTRADASNAYARTIGDAANTNAGNASYISTGILAVAYGGTGVTTFTQNGILYGNTAGALKVTSAGTEGQVLQASSTGVPQFAMLDGGSF